MIENYSFGKIVIDGVSYRSDVIVTPQEVISNWWRRKGHELCIADICKVVEEYQPEILVVGTGKFGLMKILPETEDFLQERNVRLIVLKTGDAWKRFNSESAQAQVVGAFHLTC
ncbi:hypothetical protein B6D60_07510 [candidate division KSB1 bacterium 4484_87]|nr:MAG: hypothetical protein B6D60_07510 [candidate division KSB1 bacterium 4484_87]